MLKWILILLAANCLSVRALIAQTTPNRVTILSDRLADPDPEIRREAAKRLGALGKDAEAAVPRLVVCLNDKDPGVRRAVISALDSIGSSSPSTLRGLVTSLEDPSNQARFDAASALEDLGSAAAVAVPALLKCLQSENDSLLTSCGSAAKKIGVPAKDATPVVLALLRRNSFGKRMAGLDLLSGVPDASSLSDDNKNLLFKNVLELVSDKTYEIQVRSLYALAALSVPESASQTQIEQLLKVSASPDENIREASVAVLAEIKDEAAHSALLALLSDSSSDVRLAAVKALNVTSDPTDIPPLISAMGDQSVAVRLAVISALESAELGKDEVCTSLLDREADRAVDVRVAATKAMSTCDESIVLEALLKAPTDGESIVRAEAMTSLAAIAPHKGWQSGGERTEDDLKIIQTELAGLDDPEDDVRTAAAKGLGTLAPIPTRFMGKISAEISNSNSNVREVAVRLIGSFGPDASNYAPAVVGLLKDSEPNVRLAAVWSIGLMGVRDKDSVISLANTLKDIDELEDDDKQFERAVFMSLARLGPPALPALDIVLEKVLNSSDSDEREAGIRALRDMGPQVEDALKAAYEKAPTPIPKEVLAQESLAQLMGDIGRVDKDTVARTQKSYSDMIKTASVPVKDTQGGDVSLKAGGREVVIVVGSWCPHSRKLVAFLANPTIRELTKDWKFHFVFIDETPVIQKVGSRSDGSIAANAAAPALYDISFLKQLPGDYYFYTPGQKDKKLGFPEGFDVVADKFNVGSDEIVKLELAMPDWILSSVSF